MKLGDFEETGWRTSNGLLLNIVCLCGVWVAQEKKRFVEFDGMPHSCKGQPYGKVEQQPELALEIAP
jgi:hypothetical protein